MGGAPAPFAVSPGAWDGSPDRSPGTSLPSPDMATPYKDGASRPHGMIALAGPCSSGSTCPTSDCPDVTQITRSLRRGSHDRVRRPTQPAIGPGFRGPDPV